MKCQKCGAEWTPPVGSSVLLTTCPFCGASLIKEKAGSSLENTLQTIYEQIGEAGMRNGNQLISSFMDFAPSMKKESKMLSLFVKCGGNTTLLDAKRGNASEIKAAAERVVFKMTEELMAEEHCKIICEAYCLAIGCDPVWQTEVNTTEATQEGFVSEITEAPKTELPDSNSAPKMPVRPVDFSPEFIVEGTTLTEYRGNDRHVVVPDGITEIGPDAFWFNETVCSISLPDSVTAIRDAAFQFSHLQSVSLPSGLRSIGSHAFSHTGLEAVELSESIQTIGNDAFSSTALAEVTIPGTIHTVPVSAFDSCRNLRFVRLLPGVAELDINAFANCPQLHTLVVPDTLTKFVTVPVWSSFFKTDHIREVIASDAWKTAHLDLLRKLISREE